MVRVACAVGDVIMTSTDDRPSIFQSCHFSLVRIYVVSSYLDTCNTASFGFRYRNFRDSFRHVADPITSIKSVDEYQTHYETYTIYVRGNNADSNKIDNIKIKLTILQKQTRSRGYEPKHNARDLFQQRSKLSASQDG